MKVAAYQMPLLPAGSLAAALRLIREQVARCEAGGVSLLCCPEAILGCLGGLRFGIVIRYDSNFPEPARSLAERGATLLFVPGNNALPAAKGGPELVTETRSVDIATATANRLWVIRADVAGRCGGLVSFGSSAIVDPSGTAVQSARQLSDGLIVAEL